jgi:hypothetical protein
MNEGIVDSVLVILLEGIKLDYRTVDRDFILHPNNHSIDQYVSNVQIQVETEKWCNDYPSIQVGQKDL